MNITIGKLRKIIKEELNVNSGPFKQIFQWAIKAVKNGADPKNVAKEWEIGIKEWNNNPHPSVRQDLERKMPSWMKVTSSSGLTFWLRKNSWPEFPTPKEIFEHTSNIPEEPKPTPVIQSNEPREISPKDRLAKRGNSYGHTDIGVEMAPKDLSDEEAKQWLRAQFKGAPMWKFEILRDPESKRLYAYYEIDTSG